MSKITKKAIAGTMESSDAYIEIESGSGEVSITLDSIVSSQFGDHIKTLAKSILTELNITDAHVHIVDRGALDCVIRARIETAVERGKDC